MKELTGPPRPSCLVTLLYRPSDRWHSRNYALGGAALADPGSGESPGMEVSGQMRARAREPQREAWLLIQTMVEVDDGWLISVSLTLT